jgi:hypothetical protein
MMSRCFAVLALVVVLSAGLSCDVPVNGVVLPDAPDLDGGGGTATGTLEALISSDRSVLVRGDATEAGATVSVQASVCSTFRWTVCIAERDENGDLLPCTEAGEAAARELLDLTFPSDSADPSAASAVVINGIETDPGIGGTQVAMFVDVASTTGGTDCADAVPSQQTVSRQLVISVTRPAEPLSVVISSPDGSLVAPGDSLRLVATISGGRPFQLPDPTPCEENGTTFPLNTGDPYRVVWTVNDAGLSDTPDEAAFESLCLTSDDGLTIAEAIYTAPVATGNVLFTVQVTDSSGSRDSVSVSIAVGSTAPLSIARASAAASLIAPGQSTDITVGARGGTSPYRIVLDISTSLRGGSLSPLGQSPGADEASRAQQTCAAVGADAFCEVTYTAAADQIGADTIFVTVFDDVGASATAAITLTIASSQTLALTANADATVISNVGGSAIVTATVSGGTPPFDICYEVQTAPVGADLSAGNACANLDGATNCTCGVVPTGGSSIAASQRTFSASGATGNANIKVIVRDTVGAQAIDFVSLDVSPFSGSTTP